MFYHLKVSLLLIVTQLLTQKSSLGKTTPLLSRSIGVPSPHSPRAAPPLPPANSVQWPCSSERVCLGGTASHPNLKYI